MSKIKNYEMKKLFFKIRLYLHHIPRISNQKDMAAIHATVLSIMVGVFSAYFLYINGVINTKKFDAMSMAENINKIQFDRWFYFPDDENIILASGPSDMEKLIHQIVELTLLSSNTPGGMNLGDYKIPKDPAERAERILEIMNVIAHRYPFPKSIDINSGGHSQFRAEPIIFTSFEQLCQWSDDLEKIINSLKSVTSHLPIFFPEQLDSYLRALSVREKDNIENAKDNLVEKIRGERNPYTIVNAFIRKMNEVENIYYTTSVEINRVKELQKRFGSKISYFRDIS